MKFIWLAAALFGSVALAAPIASGLISAGEKRADNDDYVVYPDVDGDEDVVYAYHAINDK
ncbi:hypothetical protein DM02DRAFT_648188 [Periconia macrospinosa]|uniref:Uncharacterized protein n=1 Tax=Periconia macrospinosa TaxID=97972 RepID=A0A2V1EEJ9_9PLEO|nr:hypothetical protein DM02DRAFT_648188 [Periconia macrospinosa]